MTTLALLAACSPPAFEGRELSPYPNPFGPQHPQYSAQPRREKPLEIVVNDGRAFVSLPGTPDRPGRHVAVVDLATQKTIARIEVGAGPTGLALHPSGRLLVLNRYSSFASVIDTATLEVESKIETEFYAVEAAFTPSGDRVVVTNRWRDHAEIWRVDGKLKVLDRRLVNVGANPRDVAISADGRFAAVAALTGLSVSIIDLDRGVEAVRIPVGAPANGVAFDRGWLYVTTLSASTHHLPFAGPDTDGDGRPGDGTPNVNFQDLQNEIAVYAVPDGTPRARYTSDTICCKDYRDVDPSDEARSGALLPPRSTWIVGGALPEQILIAGGAAFVSYSGSNEVQRFTLGDGALSPGPVWRTAGHAPHGLARYEDALLVTHRLSETLGLYDAKSGEHRASIPVGALEAGAFPATDAELGELFNFVTAPFTVDGDTACAHCHREDGNIDKAFSMPLTRYPGVGLRMTMAYRGAADTRPWFFETAMDETNFKPVINELARVENFCCTDYTLWPSGAPADCRQRPPPECAAPNASSRDGFEAARGADRAAWSSPRPTNAPSRDEHFLAVAAALIGRTESFGDGLFFEDPLSGSKRPIRLDFDGITRALGLFLLTEPRLLPNPHDPASAAARRGRALFESPATGCSACHPSPSFTISEGHNPSGLPLRMAPVVSPLRAADGTNLDLLAGGFLTTFPKSEQESCAELCGAEVCAAGASACDAFRSVRLGVPSLRGIWDRAPSMLHDGRARGLIEVLATPGHRALGPGQRGFNERDGVFDTHGGTSHLTPAEIEDLIAYLRTL